MTSSIWLDFLWPFSPHKSGQIIVYIYIACYIIFYIQYFYVFLATMEDPERREFLMQANFSGSITLNITMFWQHVWGAAANSHLLCFLFLVFASANRRAWWLERDRFEKLWKFWRLRWHGRNCCSCMQNNFVGSNHFLVQWFHGPQTEKSLVILGGCSAKFTSKHDVIPQGQRIGIL